MSLSNRGKYAESKVKDLLKSLESKTCTHARWPDARSGSLVTAPADFLLLNNGVLSLLEVKEVAHDFRLAYSNFGLDQIARMRMWGFAGARHWVIVYHSNVKLWRVLGLDVFLDRDVTAGSWDLSGFHVGSLKEQFKVILV